MFRFFCIDELRAKVLVELSVVERPGDLREAVVQALLYIGCYSKRVGINMSEHFFGLRRMHLITQRRYGVLDGCGAHGGISGTDFRQVPPGRLLRES